MDLKISFAKLRPFYKGGGGGGGGELIENMWQIVVDEVAQKHFPSLFVSFRFCLSVYVFAM